MHVFKIHCVSIHLTHNIDAFVTVIAQVTLPRICAGAGDVTDEICTHRAVLARVRQTVVDD